ncbi:MAG: hypothetical protein AAFP19_05285 [Bacteroidota bacterium]
MKSIISICLGLILLISCQSNTQEQSNSSTDSTTPQAVGKEAPSAETQAAAAGGSDKSVQDQFIHRYRGKIGNDVITLVMVNWANGQLAGWYAYEGQEKRIPLSGEINLDESFTLNSYDQAGKASSFTGSLANPEQLSGQWTSGEGAAALDYQLNKVRVGGIAANKWTGDWFRNNPQGASVMLIQAIDETNFDFALSVVQGGDTGELVGTAQIEGTRAAFKSPIQGNKPCEIRFSYKEDGIEVFQKSGTAACAMGLRANASGFYAPDAQSNRPTLSYGKDGIFETKAQHDAFKSMLRRGQYDNVASNLKTFEKSTFNDKKNGIRGTVIKGSDPSLPDKEAIIAYDNNNRFWAASMDKNDYGTVVIHYYTNVESMKTTLIEPIGLWRNPFINYLVLFPK